MIIIVLKLLGMYGDKITHNQLIKQEPQTPPSKPDAVRNLLNEFDQASKDTTGDNVVNYESDFFGN